MNLKSQICLYFGTKGVISRGGHGSVQDENWTELNWIVC